MRIATGNPHYSLCAFNLAGTQATGTYINGLVATAYNSFDPTDVGFPGSVGFTVRVRNIVTERNTFTANTALCHNLAPPTRHRQYRQSNDIFLVNVTIIAYTF